jgi:hypothetical protein
VAAVERCAVREHAAVRTDESVAPGRRIDADPDDRGVEVRAGERATERGVAEGEDPTVGGGQVVTLIIGRGGDPDDGCVEPHARR